jgi:hypothetical protein
LRRLTRSLFGGPSCPDTSRRESQAAAEQLPLPKRPEIIGGSYDGTWFLPPEEVGGTEITLPGNSDASWFEFYRYDGRNWRFVRYCRRPVKVRIAE